MSIFNNLRKFCFSFYFLHKFNKMYNNFIIVIWLMVFDHKQFRTTFQSFLNRLEDIQLKWVCKKGVCGVLLKLVWIHFYLRCAHNSSSIVLSNSYTVFYNWKKTKMRLILDTCTLIRAKSNFLTLALLWYRPSIIEKNYLRNVEKTIFLIECKRG